MAMKRLIVVLFACLYFSPAYAAVDCEANPTHPQCSGGSGSAAGPYGFVGYSSGTTDGSPGPVAMYAFCQADFGPNARVCTTREFWLSPTTELPDSEAWVFQADLNWNNIGVSGGNCFLWTDTSVVGQTIAKIPPSSSFESCTSILPVTCCAPLQ